MIKLIEKYPRLSLALFIMVTLGFTIDALPVTIMEARNFISAREMLTDNHWILTTMNGEPRYQKPPLPTWITAIFGYVFGITSVFALRWPAILMIGTLGVGIYKLSQKLDLPNAHSLRNGFIAMTSFYTMGIIIEAPWDIYAHGFMLMALYQLFLMLRKSSVSFGNGLFFVLFLACSIMSKGPVSLYVLLLSFVVAYAIAYKLKGGTLFFLRLISLLIFGIAIGGWWYFYVRITDPEPFSIIAAKETSNWGNYNVRPFYYYWSFFVQSGLWTIPAFISLLYPYMTSKVRHLKAYRFSFFWTIIAVILLSIIPEKKSRYLMPVLIPLAINIGFYIEYLIRDFKYLKSKKETVPVYFNFGLIGTIALVFPISAILFAESLSGFTTVRFVLLSVILMVIGAFIFKYLKRKNIKKVFYLILALVLSIGILALPLASLQTQAYYNPISKLNTDKLKLYAYGYLAPEVIYDFGEKIPNINTDEGYIIPKEKEFFMVTNSRGFDSSSELSKIYDIAFIETYDMNTAKKETRGHKDRLVNYLFKLKRK